MSTPPCTISLFRLAKRRRGLPLEAFQRDLPDGTDWARATAYGLRSATQSLTLPGGYRRGEPVYDVIDELVFDDESAATRCLDDLDWGHELLEESSISLLVTEPHVAKDGAVPTTYVKNFEVVTKLPGMDRADFDRYWAQVHGPLAARIPTILRYEQAHLAPGFRDSGRAPFDGLAITWWDDVAAMRAGAAAEVYAATRADEQNFLDGELPFIIATERTIYQDGSPA